MSEIIAEGRHSPDSSDAVLIPSALAKASLTRILRNSAHISSTQSVRGISITKTQKCTFSIAHVQAILETGEVLRLVLKYCEPRQNSGRDEVDFYTSVAQLFPADIMPVCCHAAYCAENRTMSLLMEDMEPGFSPFVSHVLELPDAGMREAVLRWLISLQACFWNRPELNSTDYRRGWCSESNLQGWFDTRHEKAKRALGAGVPPLNSEVLSTYNFLRFRVAAKLAERLSSGNNLTLIHGDTHGGNFMVAAGEAAGFRLLDWPNWRPGLPTDDIAYLIAAWPEQEQKQARADAKRFFFSELNIRPGGLLDYSEKDWDCDFAFSAAWVFIYSIGLIGECEGDWTGVLADRVAALVRCVGSADIMK